MTLRPQPLCLKEIIHICYMQDRLEQKMDKTYISHAWWNNTVVRARKDNPSLILISYQGNKEKLSARFSLGKLLVSILPKIIFVYLKD